MKKILFAIVMIAAVPMTAAAYVNPGSGGPGGCITSNNGAAQTCVVVEDLQRRVYQLEVLTNQLEAQIAAQPAAAAPAQVAPQPQDTTRIAALEARVSILEKTMDIMTGSVMKVLQQVIAFLQK